MYKSTSPKLTLFSGSTSYTYTDIGFNCFNNNPTFYKFELNHISGGNISGDSSVTVSINNTTKVVTLTISIASMTYQPGYYTVTTYWNGDMKSTNDAGLYYKIKDVTWRDKYSRLNDRNILEANYSFLKKDGSKEYPLLRTDLERTREDRWIKTLGNSSYMVNNDYHSEMMAGYCPSFKSRIFFETGLDGNNQTIWYVTRTNSNLSFSCPQHPERNYSLSKSSFPEKVIPYRLIAILQGSGGSGSRFQGGASLSNTAGGGSGGLFIGVIDFTNSNTIKIGGEINNTDNIGEVPSNYRGDTSIYDSTLNRELATAIGGGSGYHYSSSNGINAVAGSGGGWYYDDYVVWSLFGEMGKNGGLNNNEWGASGGDGQSFSQLETIYATKKGGYHKTLDANKLTSFKNIGVELITSHSGGLGKPNGGGSGGSASYFGNGGAGGAGYGGSAAAGNGHFGAGGGSGGDGNGTIGKGGAGFCALYY